MSIGVIGCGLMGKGIIHSLAINGQRVIAVKHHSEDNSFLDYINKELKKKRITQEEYERILENTSFTVLLEDVADCSIVIETINEDLEKKCVLFKKLSSICGKDTIFASNTSGIPIRLLAEASDRKEKVIGMHFMSPVSMMKLVEIVKSCYTSEETFKYAMDLMRSVEKMPVKVNDSPGFVTSRLMASYLCEAIRMVEDGTADAETIDSIAEVGLGFSIGPLRLADALGLDTALDVMEFLNRELGENFAPGSLLRDMVKEGKIGKKSGEGFYKY